MMRVERRRRSGGWVAVVAVCLLVLLLMAMHAPGSHGADCAPYLLVPVFLFAMVVADERVWVGFEEGSGLPRSVSRSCLFQRPPPVAFL